MTGNVRKSVIVRVEPEFHQELKIHAAKKNMTIQDYVKDLIAKDLDIYKRNEG